MASRVVSNDAILVSLSTAGGRDINCPSPAAIIFNAVLYAGQAAKFPMREFLTKIVLTNETCNFLLLQRLYV